MSDFPASPSGDSSSRESAASEPKADERPQLEQPIGAPSADLEQRLYHELRGLARIALRRERVDHTLQPTALAHEAWLRMEKQEREVVSEAHFKALAANMIRRILVDHARQRGADKRGGGLERVSLCEPQLAGEEPQVVDLLGLDEALRKLKRVNERAHSVVELHYFGGLVLREVGRVLGIREGTVNADWRFARAWLREKLGGTG